MKDKKKVSLNTSLITIAVTAFVPMLLVLFYALYTLSGATTAYSKITYSVTYANEALEFKERMDYSMYLAVVRKMAFEELGDGEMTVNGIVTVNPYEYIGEMEKRCLTLSDLATVDINRNQITRIHNTLESLKQNISTLQARIQSSVDYEENMVYLDENIYMLTSVIQEGIQEYIHVETTNLQEVRIEQERHNQKVYWLCLVIVMSVIIAVLFLTGKALRNVMVPVKKLYERTQKVAGGDFTVQRQDSRINEIAVLMDSFNDMTKEIGNLVVDIKEKEKNLHLMETKLLQEQINPHFLYNTLDTIVWLAEDNRNEEAVAMVTSLSDFFRTTLCQGRDYITVREEEAHIISYLKIQQFRYQDIMDYEIQIEEEMKKFVIPKLLLQPLVENALYHGVKKKRGKSLIRVKGFQKDEKLIFQVIDNGKGMSAEELNTLRENVQKGPDERKNKGFGLANVNQRIRHYYGETYGLYIESTENEGTEATIIIAAKNIEHLP